jgi:hypothetical protein
MELATIEHNGSVTDHKGYRWLYDVFLGSTVIIQGLEEYEANEHADRWNERDTLKAKAELFDEAIVQIQILNAGRDSDIEWLCKESLSKAKELAK